MMLNKMPANTSMDSVLDHLESATKHGFRNRAMFAIRQRLRIKDISALLISDVLGLDGKIRSCYMSADGLVFRLDDQLRTELEKYLLKRFNVPDDSLRQLFQADMMRPLFPTQKRDRFSSNTLAQHFCHLDKSVWDRFNPQLATKKASISERLMTSIFTVK